MPGWDSYRAVYGAELRAAALEFVDHGWPVVEESATSLLLITGSALDVLEVPAACGRQVCAQLRAAGAVVPVAATPTGSWWFPVATGARAPGGAERNRRTSPSTPLVLRCSLRRPRCPTAGCTGGSRLHSPGYRVPSQA